MDKLSRNRRQARLLADMDGADAAIASHRKVRVGPQRMVPPHTHTLFLFIVTDRTHVLAGGP